MDSGQKDNSDIRDKVRLENPDKLYAISDKSGNLIDYDHASGRELFNHYRHGMTNYDEVLDDIRKEQGFVQWSQQKEANTGAAEQILELYRNEHVKVIKDSQQKNSFIKSLTCGNSLLYLLEIIDIIKNFQFMIVCKECNREFESLDSLRRHRSQKHSVNAEQTYIDYVLDGVEPKCKCGCGEDVRIKNKGAAPYWSEYISGHNTGTSHVGMKRSHESKMKMRNYNNFYFKN
jgi:hypothetical protein